MVATSQWFNVTRWSVLVFMILYFAFVRRLAGSMSAERKAPAPLSACDEPLAGRYDVALLDLDGVVYVGPDPVPDAPDPEPEPESDDDDEESDDDEPAPDVAVEEVPEELLDELELRVSVL